VSRAGFDPELAEAIARRVVELLRGEEAGERPARLVDAATLARELGVEREWVYAHAEQLGAVRLGGPHGRLRFDRHEVGKHLGGAKPATWRPPRRAPRRHRPGTGTRANIDDDCKSGPVARQQRPRPDTGR
jgi:hypothetical protein